MLDVPIPFRPLRKCACGHELDSGFSQLLRALRCFQLRQSGRTIGLCYRRARMLCRPGPMEDFHTFFRVMVDTVIDEPRILHQDVLIGLIMERYLNDGQPSLHARCCAPPVRCSLRECRRHSSGVRLARRAENWRSTYLSSRAG
jgi:hypothetical protein